MCDHRRTQEPTVFFDWGPIGAAAMAEHCGTIVVLDVLSFTTSVSIACAKGCAVLPSRDAEEAAALARHTGAALASRRRAVTPESPWSLSPASLAEAPLPSQLVLPSPNGGSICATVAEHARSPRLLTCSLRNRAATAALLADTRWPRPIGVVAAGERWPDGSLRPALEDLLGAALLIDRLAGSGGTGGSGGSGGSGRSVGPPPSETLSAGADIARRAVSGLDADGLRQRLVRCASGAELVEGGFGRDVELAAELDLEEAVGWDGTALRTAVLS